MNPDRAAEIAGRLNPSICRFGQGFGGIPELTQADIAMALGMLKHERERLWVRVIYCGHEQHRTELERYLLMRIVDMAAPERWQIEKPGTLMQCIRTAVDEVCAPVVCGTCNGQRNITLSPDAADLAGTPELAGKTVVCEPCKGFGIERRSDYWRANSTGIHRELWRRHWRERYNRILDIVRMVDDLSKSAFAHRLGDAA